MIEDILARRSIRAYTADPVSDEALRQILLAGMAAPSAYGSEPWVFVLIRDPALLARIPEVHPHAAMVPGAQAAILVCHDSREQEGQAWFVQDLSAATENILLAISALGLGGVWLGVYPRQERVDGLRALLALEPHLVPFALVPIGHPAEQLPARAESRDDKVLWR